MSFSLESPFTNCHDASVYNSVQHFDFLVGTYYCILRIPRNNAKRIPGIKITLISLTTVLIYVISALCMHCNIEEGLCHFEMWIVE